MSSGLGLGGLVSGVDTDGIIQKLISIEQKRIDLETAKKAQLQAKQTAWSQVRDSLSTLRSALDSVRFATLYRSRSVTPTDSSVAAVTAAAGATVTSHSLAVSNLAVAQVMGSAYWNSPTEQVGTTHAGAIQINGRGIAVDATDSLYSIRDKINGLSGANVSADVVPVVDAGTTRYRLVLTSAKTGLDGALQVPNLASSDPTAVQASGSLAGGPARVSVQQLALYKQVQSASVSSTQTFTGAFTIRTSTKSYTIDASDGATLSTIAGRIKAAVGTDLGVTSTTANGQTQLTLNGPGLAVTNDTSGLAQALGLTSPDLSAGNIAQQAQLTVNGQSITSDSNTVADPAGLTGLSLTLGNTTAQVQTVSSGAAASFGFTDTVPAQNARFTLDGVEYTNKSSNVISDIIPKLTITLQKGGETTLTVGPDSAKAATAAQSWVKALNDSMDLLKGLTSYDSDTKQAGILQGDGLARNLQTGLRSMLSNTDPALPEGFKQLSDIGITTGAYGTNDYGKVLFNEERFKAKLAADPEGVARVMGALRKNAALAANGAAATSSGADTSDPTRVFSANDVISGLTDGSRFGSAGGGWQSDPGVASPWLEITFAQPVSIDQLQLYLPDTKDYPIANGLKDFKILGRPVNGDYDEAHPLADVQGNTSAASTFEFAPRTLRAIKLQVLATNNGTPARVLSLIANQVTAGVASNMFSYVNSSLGSSGTLETRSDTYSDQIKSTDDLIQKMTNQMTQREQALRDQFSRMEAALAKMQSQGNALLGQLGAMSGQSSK